MKRNRVLAVFSASFALAGVLASLPATANAASFYKYYSTSVQVNGSTVSAPGHITEKDPFGGANAQATSFLPIWYIDQALGKFNVKVSWTGTTGILNLTTPSGMTVNYPSAPRPVTINSGTMVIQINGKPVTYAPRISYYDEGSGGIITTFVPVYYLEKSIGYMGVQTGWNGVDWTMQYGSTTPPTQVTGSTPKLGAAIAFAKAVGLSQDTSGVNPYSDVPQSDWGYVHALTENYTWRDTYDGATVAMNAPLFSADSSSKFGAADNVTASTIDRAFQIFNGLATGHDSYLPGGSVVGLGNATGLNAGLSTTSGNLTESDFATMSANLATIEKGYKSLGNGEYQLVYRPNPKSYWTTSVPASTYAQDWANAIAYINKTVIVSAKVGAYETKAPDVSDRVTTTGNYPIIGGVSSPEQYSLDGGATWHTANGDIGFDSVDPANGGTATPPSYVLIKDTNGSGITVMYDYHNNAVEFAAGGVWYDNTGQLIASFQ